MKFQLILPAVMLAACVANRTTIQSTWTDEEYRGAPLDRVAVVAMFETRADSLAFERDAATYLATEGVETVPAHEILAPADAQRLGEAEVRERLADTDIDGILIFRLVAVDERREYQVPTPYLLNGPPDRSGGDPSSVYSERSSGYYWFPGASPAGAPPSGNAQGYWTEQTFLIAETALFDNRHDRLVWTGRSETLDDTRFERTSESIVRSVARRLLATDLIDRMDAASAPASHAERG